MIKIGVLRAYYKDNDIDFIIGYSEQEGFFKTKNIDKISKNCIWFSNILEVENFSDNIKNNFFFGFNEDKIFYYHGLLNGSIQYKIKKLYENYKKTIECFKINYMNLSFEDLLKVNKFSELFFKNNDALNNKHNVFFEEDLSIKKNVVLDNINKSNCYLFYPKYKLIKRLEEKFFPCGSFKKISLYEFIKDKNLINNKNFLMYFKVKILSKNNSNLDINNYYIFNYNELNYFKKLIKFEILEVYISEKNIRLKEILRKQLNIVENNIAVEIFSTNYIDSLKNKSDKINNNLIISEEKNILYPLIKKLIENKIDIISYGNSEILLNVKKEDKLKLANISESMGFIYPIDLLK